MRLAPLAALALLIAARQPATAADLVVLTTGAYLPVAAALKPVFEARTHDHVILSNDTAGAIFARASGGAAFDLVILTPSAIAKLVEAGIVQSSPQADVARVGIGVVVRTGTPQPDIGDVEAFRQTLLHARSVAYIDPRSGGSSGIYVAQMLQRLGIADQVAPHALLVDGGRVADHVASGEADLGIHQISEIIPVAGVTLVGPIPAALQNDTVYTAAISRTAREPTAAAGFLALLAGPDAKPVLREKGMQPAIQ